MGRRTRGAEKHQKIQHWYYFKGLPGTQVFAEFVRSSGAASRLKPPTRQTPAEICSTTLQQKTNQKIKMTTAHTGGRARVVWDKGGLVNDDTGDCRKRVGSPTEANRSESGKVESHRREKKSVTGTRMWDWILMEGNKAHWHWTISPQSFQHLTVCSQGWTYWQKHMWTGN